MEQPELRQVWKDDVSHRPMVVVALDDRFVYVKDATSSKRSVEAAIARGPVGSGLVGRGEFAEHWTRVS